MTLTATTFPGLDPLLQSGVIAVVRLSAAVRLGPAAAALAAGGVGAVEVTLTTPGAIAAIADLASDKELAGCVIGAGTVLDESAAREVIVAGARFVVSPALNPAVIRACRDREVPCMPGAFTPTELLGGLARGCAGREAVPRVGGRSRLTSATCSRRCRSCGSCPRAGVARERRRVDSRRRRRGERGKRARKLRVLTDESTAELTARARSFVERVAQARRHLGNPSDAGRPHSASSCCGSAHPVKKRLFESSDLVTCFGGRRRTSPSP